MIWILTNSWIRKILQKNSRKNNNFVEYNQELKIENESDDATSAEDLAIDPFDSVYDGKELYGSVLQGLGRLF